MQSLPTARCAGWATLPLDVIQHHILPHFDHRTLLLISSLNHSLNRLAIVEHFGSGVVKDIHERSKFTNAPDSRERAKLVPRPMAQALSSALWIRSLEHIDYRITSDWDDHLVLNDLSALTRFIERMPTTPSLKSLRLEYSVSSTLIEEYLYYEDLICRWSPETSKRWLSLMAGLVDAALAKGCEVISFEGEQFAPWTFFSRKRWILCWPGRYFGYKFKLPSLRATFPGAGRCQVTWPFYTHALKRRPGAQYQLRELVVSSAFAGVCHVWRYLFYLLKQNYSTIRHLRFTSHPDDLNLAMFSNSGFLWSLHFPQLESFSLEGRSWENTPIAVFLSNHRSTLTTLDIGHASVEFGSEFSTDLPVLNKIRARPPVLLWLLKDGGRRCPQLQHVQVNWVPNGFGFNRDWRLGIDAMIACNNLSQPLSTFETLMDVGSIEWGDWMDEQVVQGEESLTAQMQFKRMSLCHIRHRYCARSRLSVMVDVVAEWIGLFPGLEHLEVEWEELESLSEAFSQGVLMKCKALKSFGYNGQCLMEIKQT